MTKEKRRKFKHLTYTQRLQLEAYLKAKLSIPDFVTDVSLYPDSQELLLVSDCVITDYSSIIYDFLITKRPAFIFAVDYEHYKQTERKLYFSLEDTPFSLARTNDELVSNISKLDITDYEVKVDEFLKKYGLFDKGDSSKKLCEVILNNRNNKDEIIL